MPRSRYVYAGGKLVAEWQDGEIVFADATYYGEGESDAPMVLPDTPGYVSPVTGLWVEGRRQRREDLKRSGSRPWEGLEQERKEAARAKACEAAKVEKRLEEAVMTTWYAMPPDKRRRLMES